MNAINVSKSKISNCIIFLPLNVVKKILQSLPFENTYFFIFYCSSDHNK